MSLIRNSNQAKQAIDFSGLENKKIHPSDIDAVLEFDNEALILIEVKRDGNKIPTGQRLLLERMCNKWGDKAIVLFVTHSFKQDDKDIPLAECFVDSYYYYGKWHKSKEANIVNVLNELGKWWGINKLQMQK